MNMIFIETFLIEFYLSILDSVDLLKLRIIDSNETKWTNKK